MFKTRDTVKVACRHSYDEGKHFRWHTKSHPTSDPRNKDESRWKVFYNKQCTRGILKIKTNNFLRVHNKTYTQLSNRSASIIGASLQTLWVF